MNDQVLASLWNILSFLPFAVTLPGTALLLLLTGAAVVPRRRASRIAGATSLAVVVPAHNEEKIIGRCIRSLRACRGADRAFDVVVVADNCSDRTVDAARRAGARVLERNDTMRRGKGHALDFAFRSLLPEGWDAFAVVDADSEVDRSFVEELRILFESGSDAVQCRYGVRNPDDSVRTRLMHIALLAFNTLRPRGRDRLGLSAGILGNGFALSRATLEAVPYEARSVVEDVEYHIALVRAGRRVRFAASTEVRADMPSAGRGVRTQRARWEGGRFLLLARLGPVLARQAASGQFRLAEPLADLFLMPLALHTLLILPAFLAPSAWVRGLAAASLVTVLLHVVTAVLAAGEDVRRLRDLAVAPFYIAWKVAMLPALLRSASAGAEWVRTERKA